MSINSCSINEHTINTLCGRRRQLIINWLLPTVTGGGQQQHVHPDTKIPLNIFRRQDDTETIIDTASVEMPHMMVTVDIGGQSYSQTIERDQGVMPFVTISKLSVASGITEQVNILDIKIRIL